VHLVGFYSILKILFRHFFSSNIQPDSPKLLSENSHILLPQHEADLGSNSMEPDGIRVMYQSSSFLFFFLLFLSFSATAPSRSRPPHSQGF
jgi:hypothetical protein